jgi:hypothetical protein
MGEEDLDSEQNIRNRLEKLLGNLREKTAEAEEKERQAATSSQEAETKRQAAEALAKRLEGDAAEARDRAKQAEEEGRQAARVAADKQREADAVVLKRDSIGIKDVVEEVAGSAEIRAQVQRDLEAVGIIPERIKTGEGLREALKEASDAGVVLGGGWCFGSSPRR